MTEKEYSRLVRRMEPPSPVWKDCFHAFWVGGLICVLGQLLLDSYMAAGLEKEQAQTGMEEVVTEIENKCRELENSFFDLQMENLQLKKELEKYKNNNQ